MKQIYRFSIVGALGFITDAAVLSFLIHFFNFHPIAARPISFLMANLVTWFCNRHFTFTPHAERSLFNEWFRYMSVNSVGAIINLGIYTCLILSNHTILSHPIIALAVASVGAMFFNFFCSKHFAFSAPKQKYYTKK